MDTTPNQHSEVLESTKTPDAKRNFLTTLKSAASSKIATTALAVSAAVAGVFGHEPVAEAKPHHAHIQAQETPNASHAPHTSHSPHAHKEKAPHKPHKIHYQQFPQGKAKLEKIERKELERLIGKPGVAESLSPLREHDIQKIQQHCEFHDPWKTNIPLVRIKPTNLEKSVSRHFKVKDLVRIDPKDLYLVKPGFYQKHNGEYFRTIARIDAELVDMLERVQKEMQPKKKPHKKGQPKTPKVYVELHTNEGFRPYGENARTYWRDCHGNAACTHEKSQHVSGMGTDINIAPGLQDACLKVVEKRGTGGVGMHGANIVHLDSRRGKKAVWGYGVGGKKEGVHKKSHHVSRTAKK